MSSSEYTQNIHRDGKISQRGWSDLEGEWLPVRISKKPATITVSRKALKAALKKGVRGDEGHCFFAVGMQEDASNGVMEAIVQRNHTFIRWSGTNYFMKYANGVRVKEFTQNYDKNAAVLFDQNDNHVLELGPVAPSNYPGARTGSTGSERRKPPRKTERKSRAQLAAESMAAAS